MIFAVKGREKFWKIKRGRERKSLGSPALDCARLATFFGFLTFDPESCDIERSWLVQCKNISRHTNPIKFKFLCVLNE